MVIGVLEKHLSLIISLGTLISNQPPIQTLLAGKYTLKILMLNWRQEPREGGIFAEFAQVSHFLLDFVNQEISIFI